MAFEQALEERLDQHWRVIAQQFDAAEAIDLVARELQLAVACGQLSIKASIRTAAVHVRVVLYAVNLDHHADAGGQKHEEVHAMVEQRFRAPLGDRLRVPVQPHLWEQGGQARDGRSEALKVRLEQSPLRR